MANNIFIPNLAFTLLGVSVHTYLIVGFYIDIGKLSFLELLAFRSSISLKADESLTVRFNDLGWDFPAFLVNAICVILIIFFLLPLIPLRWIINRQYRNERVYKVIRRYWFQTLVVLLLLKFARLCFSWLINMIEFVTSDPIYLASAVFTVYVFSLCMQIFFFTYLGIHTYHRTKTVRVSMEIGTQRHKLSESSMNLNLPVTWIIIKFLGDIDIRKSVAPFHYVLLHIRMLIYCVVLVTMLKSETSSLIVLTFMNCICLYWMM